DAEELSNLVEQLSSDDKCIDQVNESEEVHLTLFPSEYRADSDQDNGQSEDDDMCRILTWEESFGAEEGCYMHLEGRETSTHRSWQ
ncbi:hypothetical protein HHI36_002337, partial [Cryptolaemus montrouzieri]